MLFQALDAHLKGQNLAPCYLIRGSDPYLRQAAYKKLTDQIKNPFFNLNVLQGCDSEDDLIAALCIMPFDEKYRMVAVKEIKEGALGSKIIKYLQNPEPFSVLILFEGKGQVYSDIARYAQVIDCNRLSDDDLKKFISSRLPAIEPAAAQRLIMLCGGDIGRLDNECKKLYFYCDGRAVTLSDVENIASGDIEYKIYEFTTALSQKDKNKAFEIWGEFKKTDETYLFNSLYRHFRRLLFMQISKKTDEDLAKLLDAKNVWSIKHYRRQAANFGANKLKEILDYLENAEFQFKSGQFGQDAAINNALLRILNI